MPYIQAKIRLTEQTNSILSEYCEYSAMNRSPVIDKALQMLFRQDQDFARFHDLDAFNRHNTVPVSELEDIIFNRYKVMIYIHAEQGERIGIDLDYWPKCMGKYTIKEFLKKIVSQCLPDEVKVTVFDHNGDPCNNRLTIRKLKGDYPSTLKAIEDCHEIWGEFSERHL